MLNQTLTKPFIKSFTKSEMNEWCTSIEMNECWMNGLQKKVLCYEGVLNSIDDFLEIYRRQTVTTRGTRTSSNLQSDPGRTVCPESKKAAVMLIL